MALQEQEAKDKKMSNKRTDPQRLLNNKTVHLEVPGEVHRKLRALLFLRESTIQGFFRLMAEHFVNGDEYISKLLEERVSEIKDKKISAVKNVNKKDLYNAIEENSPLSNK